jgi:hypothetical protein
MMTFLFTAGGVLGALLVVVHLTNKRFAENTVIGWSERTALLIVALSAIWMVHYADETKWAPWPPALLLIWALNAYLILRRVAQFYSGNGNSHPRAQ